VPSVRTLVIVAAGALALFIIWRIAPWESRDPVVAAECRRSYQTARTAADTAVVDYRRPIVSRGQATSAPSCGLLRKTGRL
jgi:hypothetical protein